MAQQTMNLKETTFFGDVSGIIIDSNGMQRKDENILNNVVSIDTKILNKSPKYDRSYKFSIKFNMKNIMMGNFYFYARTEEDVNKLRNKLIKLRNLPIPEQKKANLKEIVEKESALKETAFFDDVSGIIIDCNGMQRKDKDILNYVASIDTKILNTPLKDKESYKFSIKFSMKNIMMGYFYFYAKTEEDVNRFYNKLVELLGVRQQNQNRFIGVNAEKSR